MERLPGELCLKIFCFLDHQNLASAQQVCRKWRTLGADNTLWSNLFKERWGDDRATFYAPVDSKSWKDVYEVQDRCDRVGLGLKIVREGVDYYLIHQGEIQRYLGSREMEWQKIFHLLVPEKKTMNPVAMEFWTESFSSLETWKLLPWMPNEAGYYEVNGSPCI